MTRRVVALLLGLTLILVPGSFALAGKAPRGGTPGVPVPGKPGIGPMGFEGGDSATFSVDKGVQAVRDARNNRTDRTGTGGGKPGISPMGFEGGDSATFSIDKGAQAVRDARTDRTDRTGPGGGKPGIGPLGFEGGD
ncbi:MAG: hypothetical protein HY660_13260 [Armatimonadetes bacterium]|nr:hypothetical protein [Armatimonadota bacterium]